MMAVEQHKTDTEPLTDTAALEDVPKKLMRSIQDIGRQLEYVTSKCNTVESLFASELVSRRAQMKDLCEKLLFEAPKANGAYARDKLWRYVLYEVVSKAKRLKSKGGWTATERAYLQHHILGGIGQLSMLMLKLEETVAEFKGMKLRICPNGVDNVLPGSLLPRTLMEEPSAEVKWAIDILTIFLLNIGDLCRYLTEVYSHIDQDLYDTYYDRAQEYYTQAFHLNRSSGMAHNQLGNLSIKVNGGVDSIYYFLYSLVSKTPCPGALSNLRRLLDTQLVYFARLPGTFDWKPIDVFTHNLIGILNQFLGESTHLTKFEKSCQDTIGSFIILLSGGVTSLDKGYLFYVMSICIMSVWHLLGQESQNISPAVCFSIGIFVHLMEKLYATLKEKSKLLEIVEIEMPSREDFRHEVPEVKDDLTPSVETAEEESQRRRRRVLPRRRKRINDVLAYLCSEDDDDWNDKDELNGHFNHGSDSSSDFESTDSDGESESEGKESEESDGSESSYENEDKGSGSGSGPVADSSEVSDISYQAEVDIERKAAELKLSQGSDNAVSDLMNGKKASVKLKNMLDLAGLLECWDEIEPILVAVLPFMRWLRCSHPVQSAFAASTEKAVLERFCQALNILESTNWSIVFKQNWAKNDQSPESMKEAMEVEAKLVADWHNVVEGKIDKKPFSLELPEDVAMSGWYQFEPLMSGIEQKCLTRNNMIVTRIGRILEFGQWLVGTEEFAVIRSEKTFLVPSVEEFKRHMQKLQLEKFHRRLSKSKEAKLLGREYEEDLTKNGKLRKFNRRRRRRPESDFHKNKTNEDEKLYLVFDLEAVLKQLRVIQKLALHPKFIIVFPSSVTRALDDLKDKEVEGSKVARIATRWLERNFHKRGQSIQLLGKDKKVPLDNTEYPLVHSKKSLEFYDALETCNYIRLNDLKYTKLRPSGKFFGDARDKYKIFYLTGHKDLLSSDDADDQEVSPIAICKSAYVYLDRASRYQHRRRNRGSRGLQNSGG